jgi:hypothetical protein
MRGNLLLIIILSTTGHCIGQSFGEVDLQCHLCNASYFCARGERLKCPANSLAAVAFADKISECVCNPGYLREADACTLGQPPAWYFYGNRSACVHTRETVAQGASGHKDCVCVPGFAGLPSAEAKSCVACPADTYTDQYNSSECMSCPEHSSHKQTQRSSVTSCECDPGYTGHDGGPCVACAAGKFKDEAGNSECRSCIANTYSLAAARKCVACHEQASSVIGSPSSDSCLCNAGFEPNAGSCRACAEGSFKNTSANEQCRPCLNNTFSSLRGATACIPCSVSSIHSSATPLVGGLRCECNAGYTQHDLSSITPNCSVCPPNTFQSSKGQTTCQQCRLRLPGARSGLPCPVPFVTVSLRSGVSLHVCVCLGPVLASHAQ